MAAPRNRQQRQALTAEVAQLQGSADEWAKKGGRAKLERCGGQQRLCVRVDSQKAYGKEAAFVLCVAASGLDISTLRKFV